MPRLVRCTLRLSSSHADRAPLPWCAARAQILTPVQEARIVVDAHPYVVNALALCTAVAEAAGAPTAELRMGDLMVRPQGVVVTFISHRHAACPCNHPGACATSWCARRRP